MATPRKAVNKEKKKPVPVKTSLNSPYDLTWAPLEKGHSRFILNTVTEKLDTLGLRKNNVRVFRKWGNIKQRKKRRSDLQNSAELRTGSLQLDSNESIPVESTQLVTTEIKLDESIQLDTPELEPSSVQRGWTVKNLRKQLAIGINEVTKGLERNELNLVLVCDSVRPAHITAHLIPLSKTRSVPACKVPGLSANIAPSLGLSSVLALGFKRAADTFYDTVTALVPKMPPVGVSWIPKCTLGQRKRKLQPSPEATEPSAEFQPLKVKKIIPNPSKIRKPKKNKTKKIAS